MLFFELPESAAVTGLWLGPTANRDEAFTHVVAPRGAAQQVYREEVRARREVTVRVSPGARTIRKARLRACPACASGAWTSASSMSAPPSWATKPGFP